MATAFVRRNALHCLIRTYPGDFVNFRPLPPEYNRTLVCNQELTEYHELKHSHKMFFDNVWSRYVTFDNVFTVAILWQRVGCELEFKLLLVADTDHSSAFPNDNRPAERFCGPRYRMFHWGERG